MRRWGGKQEDREGKNERHEGKQRDKSPHYMLSFFGHSLDMAFNTNMAKPFPACFLWATSIG